MNYASVYQALINKSKERMLLDGYSERHHIIPVALGGLDGEENIAVLTAREHFIAHMLLAKIHGGSMWYAVIMMKGKKNRYINSKLYDVARKESSLHQIGKFVSKDTRKAMGIARIGYVTPQSTKDKMSLSKKGVPLTDRNKIALRESCARPESKKRRSEARIISINKPGAKDKLSQSMKLRWQDAEYRNKVLESRKLFNLDKDFLLKRGVAIKRALQEKRKLKGEQEQTVVDLQNNLQTNLNGESNAEI